MYTLTLADRVYLARYYEIDGSKLMAALLNRSPQAVFNIINTMKYNGEYDLYRSLTDEEYEKILNCAEVKHGAIEKHDHQ
ncbi:hypothetical protein BK138_16245 [Paenibacillus rhizosphaerae]|uniref:Uncharacterized protein n=1 Tax=Paenibacillus rhizosphaerae TaxID=297318 RepID=A0A1R1ES80_9BACL|nr:hypothetical protein BK138_16245 [Paenibacillus rhizosphaerae]